MYCILYLYFEFCILYFALYEIRWYIQSALRPISSDPAPNQGSTSHLLFSENWATTYLSFESLIYFITFCSYFCHPFQSEICASRFWKKKWYIIDFCHLLLSENWATTYLSFEILILHFFLFLRIFATPFSLRTGIRDFEKNDILLIFVTASSLRAEQ